MTPTVSVIIGTHNRLSALSGLLAALQQQTLTDWEAVICHEGDDFGQDVKDVLDFVADPRFKLRHFGGLVGDWHRTVKIRGALQSTGRYLMFPQDDVYYVPTALELMVKTAEEQDYGLTYCRWLNPQENYTPWHARPQVGHIDIGGFLLRRDVFNLVPWTDGSQIGDGLWIESIVAVPEVRHGETPFVLYVKN